MEYTIQYSDTFARWLRSLKDIRAKQKIKVRLDRVLEGNFGDHKSVGSGVSELRILYGAGYRVYYTVRNNTVVFLLCGVINLHKRMISNRQKQWQVMYETAI